MDKAFDGRVVLITGASRGIGRSMAERFAREGAKVIINYNSNKSLAEEAVRHIQSEGGEAVAISADLSKVAEVNKLIEESLRVYGKIDVLINNAGLMITKPLEAVTEEDFDRLFATNVKGTFFACQRAAQHMTSGGRIINFSTSVTGAMFPQYSVYAGTKGAVEQFTRQLAKELGPKGITINAVAPGPVNTELFSQGKSQEQIDAIVRMNSFQRLGEPEDIIGAVLFLAGAESQWVTGQTIRVNGGFV
ncbi:3-ketoacyl-ACP reductase [Brevibacillus reuszeri]|uniref:3-ketoacyl-ACP reductase n=1 Tax=Brevibacillus reuszeri TaxID=54915 RepID=A0A0K9YKR7_9BACL|nr:SDR family oxidoreductase [Brevibacillus reuszeri]KNB69252.1 3-ketoacyl-ACP reductase [Brevibacillus reuszeri]MED1860195.1 SDR family oxidoreductase [Brevibacillus reuszeri]GED71608.1 3-ketoacyl-ACP reductase [Brevibacillus reuszeri]